MATKLNFYLHVIYGESNFYHPQKQKFTSKVLKVRNIYQNCLSRFPFPLIPKSVNTFYEFCETLKTFEEEREMITDFNNYFIYGQDKLEEYFSLGFCYQVPTLEEVLKANLDKLEDFHDDFFNNVIIYDEKIKGKLIYTNPDDEAFDLLPFGFDESILSREKAHEICSCIRENGVESSEVLATQSDKLSNLYEIKVPAGLYYNQAYNLEHIGDLIDEGVVICLTGGIGRGKTTLANDIFYMKSHNDNYDFNYLVNRSSAKEQVNAEREIEVEVEILGEIFTEQSKVKYNPCCYQVFDYNKINPNKITLNTCDELQYVFADSTFNEETYQTYEWLLKTIPMKCMRHILMGANAKGIIYKLAKELPDVPFLVIDADDDFSYVDNFYYYNNIRTAYHYIDKAIKDGKKTVYGTNNIETVLQLKAKYPNQICVRHSKHKPVKPNNYDDLLPEQQKEIDSKIYNWERWEKEQQETAHLYHQTDKGYYFDCPILISTKANDNGINYCDETITNVFSDFYFDYITGYQWVGRVRWQKETDQRVNFFIRTMQRDKFEKILQESEYYQAYLQSKQLKQSKKQVQKQVQIQVQIQIQEKIPKLTELYPMPLLLPAPESYKSIRIYETLTETLNNLKGYNIMQDFYNKRELGIMIRIKEAFDYKTRNVDKDNKDLINNIFTKVYVDTLIHDYIFNNNPLVELKNANTGISEMEWQEKIQAKEERLNQLQQQRIELLESVLDKRLTSTEFKDVAEQLNFRNPKDNRIRKTVKTLKSHLQELGFDIQEPKSKGITYKRIIKK